MSDTAADKLTRYWVMGQNLYRDDGLVLDNTVANRVEQSREVYLAAAPEREG